MGSDFYIRIRGKPQGPYSTDHLRGLVKRGQLSRLHEVSADGVTWGRASSYPELFAHGEVGVQEQPAQSANSSDGLFGDTISIAPVLGEAPANRPPPSGGQKIWFYTSGGAKFGPVDFATLQALIAGGKLGASDGVWTEGMADWVPPHMVPGLVPASGGSGSLLDDLKTVSHDVRRGLFPAVEQQSGDVSIEACRAIAGTRPWMLFIAILMYLVAALYAGLGVFVITLTAHGVFGLFYIIGGILTAILATLLLNCFNRGGDLLHTKKQRELERALHSVRRFWMFLGVMLIVALSIMAISLLVLLSIGSSLSNFISSFPQPR